MATRTRSPARRRAAAGALLALVLLVAKAPATGAEGHVPTPPGTPAAGTASPAEGHADLRTEVLPPSLLPTPPSTDPATTVGTPATDGRAVAGGEGDGAVDAATRVASSSATCALGAPPGGPSYSFQAVGSDGCPMRWDPCHAIDWWYNPMAGDRPFADVQWAFDEVAARTGLVFHFRGPTRVGLREWLERPVDQGTGLLVAWGPYFPPALGETVTQGVLEPAPAEIVRAGVRLNAVSSMTRHQFRSVILHEVLHAIGLGHADDPNELMHPYFNGIDWFRTGDAAAAHLLGGAQGCVPGSVRAAILASFPPPVLAPSPLRFPPTPPTTVDPHPPVGSLDSVEVVGRTVRVTGWAFDPNTSRQIGIAYGSVAFGRPVRVAVGLNGVRRSDVGLHVDWLGEGSGFDLSIELPPGRQAVCVAALDHNGWASTGGQTPLGCHEVDIPK